MLRGAIGPGGSGLATTLTRVRTTLADLLSTRPVLLADGATGTNYFAAGLTAGDAARTCAGRIIRLVQNSVSKNLFIG